MQQKGKTRNRRKTKKMRRQKQRKKIKESVWMSPQLAISTSEQEGVRPLIATALLKGYSTLLVFSFHVGSICILQFQKCPF